MSINDSLLSILAAAVVASPAALASQDVTHRVTLTEGTNMAAALSPDGRMMALDLQGTIWLVPIAGGKARAVTDALGDARQPAWSPDGDRIAFQSYRDGTWHIWSMAADGSDLTQHTIGPFDHREPHWSPDGTRIAFSSDRNSNYDVFELTVATGEIVQRTTNAANDYRPAYAPDGMQLAFVSDRRSAGAGGGGGGGGGIWIVGRDGVERLAASTPGGTPAGPSWSPDGTRMVFSVRRNNPLESRLYVTDLRGDSEPGTTRILSDEGEDVFPFRSSWMSNDEIVYTASGNVRRRAVMGGTVSNVPFEATVTLARAPYTRRPRDFESTGSQPVLGILRPTVSPDGSSIAFIALGDLWLMPIGGTAARLTNDRFMDLDPAWSPDGSRLAFATDRNGTLDLWVRDMSTGEERQITHLPGGAHSPSWSPDGTRLAFRSELGLSGDLQQVNIASGEVTMVRRGIFAPSRATWSPDGSIIAVAALRPYSSLYREGRNEILLISLDGAPDRYVTPMPHRNLGSRNADGPVWSPDGRHMAFAADGALHVVPVNPDGGLAGPPRRFTDGLADAFSWTGDGKTVVYRSGSELRRVSLADGVIEPIALDLDWNRTHPTDRVVVHAGRLFDGRSPNMREDVDIVIEGHRIVDMRDHDDALHRGEVVDASDRTVMPGLIDSHAHQGFGFGEARGRLFLSFGVTTVRDPASDAMALLERREAVESGVRVGPREFATGRMFDGARIYYNLGNGMRSGSHLAAELEFADAAGYDLIKTYVRLPDVLQRRVIREAHDRGIAVTSHEIYPAVANGADHVEHIGGTSRRGYSPKVTRTSHTYSDVISLLTESGMTITPTVSLGSGFSYVVATDPAVLDDVRMTTFFPQAMLESLRRRASQTQRDMDGAWARLARMTETVRRVVRGGGRVIAGTDAPIVPYGLSLHAELELYVMGGLTPFEALQTATSVPAAAFGAGEDLGTIRTGTLADLVVVRGNPLENISDARRVEVVVKNGEVFTVEELLRGGRGLAAPVPDDLR